jgi:hypothetical protein
LEEPTTPKPIPLVILEIKIRTNVTLINSITHAFEVFRTPNTILKDTHVIEISKFQLVPLVKPIDDLAVGVKHVVLGD